MYFSRSFLIALVAAPFLAFAQTTGPNPFTLTPAFTATAGQTSTLTWTPTTGGTVSLILRDGNTGALNAGTPIASGIPNNGRYTWDIPSSAVRGSQYTIEIVSDANPDETNFSARFVLSSDNVAAPTTATPSASASSSGTSMSAPTMLTPSAFPVDPNLTINTNPPSTTSATRSAAASSSSSQTTMTTSMTGSSSSMSSSATSNPDLTAGGASSSSVNAAPRATAMVGMLGAVALGALAL